MLQFGTVSLAGKLVYMAVISATLIAMLIVISPGTETGVGGSATRWTGGLVEQTMFTFL